MVKGALCGVVRGSVGGLRRFRDELRMWEYMRGVREWSGLVLSGKDRSGGGSECHVTWAIVITWHVVVLLNLILIISSIVLPKFK